MTRISVSVLAIAASLAFSAPAATQTADPSHAALIPTETFVLGNGLRNGAPVTVTELR